MKLKLQFAGCFLALGSGVIVVPTCYAQRERANWAQNRQGDKPPKQERQQQRQDQSREQRQGQRQERKQQQDELRRAPAERRQNESVRRPAEHNLNRPDVNTRPNNNPNRPPSAYTPPPRRDFNNLTPQEKRKVMEDNRRLQNLPPAQRQELQQRAQVWNKLTPEQRQHIRGDVLPKWQQLPPDRRRAIQQRLGVLQNMPESARNQHLNDPNFTRGMSEEDRAMLRDLSHMHVGGAPDPPSE